MWRVQVLGGLALRRGDTTITRFESRKVGALLAYLALHPNRSHAREVLIDLCWPDAELDAGRQRLRQALSTLRRQLEPPGTSPGSVIIADRSMVRLNPSAVTCDALEFDRHHRARRFNEAAAMYVGELLPGYYDDWIQDERIRLAALFESLPPVDERHRLGCDVAAVPSPAAPTPVMHLPPYVTTLFGREVETDRLAAAVEINRLVTLTGFGGVGKTRLAVETARRLASRFDPVVFVPLADCAAPIHIVEFLRAALHLPSSEEAVMDQVAEALGARRPLLVLDNFEHLAAGGGADVVTDLLHRLPNAACLVTSRRTLGVEGEREFALDPLPVVSPGADVLQTAACASVALFVDRAQAARPAFQVNERNRGDVLAICAALEGIPLSIEIAASRIRAMPVREMASQLSGRLDWLRRTGPTMDRTPRQRSLTTVLDWSWQLLAPDLQQFLCRLATFRGSWTSEYAAAVCDTPHANRRLKELAADSLVRRMETDDGRTRYQMLEIVRQYAAERQDPEERRATRRRYRQWFLTLSGDKFARRTLARDESANVQGAIETAIEDGDADSAFDLLLGIGSLWLAVAGADSVLAYCQAAASLCGGDSAKRSKVLAVAVDYALTSGDSRLARRLAEESLDSAEELAEAHAAALVATARIEILTEGATDSAASLLDEAASLARACGADTLVGSALRNLGRIANRRGDFDAAHSHLTESVRLLEKAGDEVGAIHSLDNLANTAVQRGDLESALRIYAECQERALAAGDLSHHAKIYQNTATVLARQGRWQESIDAGRECIRLCQSYGNVLIVSYALWNIAEPLAFRGKEGAAAQIIGFMERYWVDRFGALSTDDHSYLESLRSQMVRALGPTLTGSLWRDGARMSFQQAVDLALLPDA